MSYQVEEQTESELLDKKIKTENNKELTIKTGSIMFAPFIRTEKNKEIRETTLSANNILGKLKCDSNNFITELKEGEINSIDFRRDLLYAFMEDEYSEKLSEINNYDNIEKHYIPTIMFLAETADNTTVIATVINPFKKGCACDLLEHIKLNKTISIEGSPNKRDDFSIILDDDMEVGASIHEANKLPIEKKVLEDRSELKFIDLEYITDSEYNNWLKVPVENNSESEYELTTELFPESSWTFEKPVVWDEKYKIVDLVESQAYSDINQLEYVYMRPSNSYIDYSKTRTSINEDTSWEIAIDKPYETEDSSEENSYRLGLLFIGVWMICLLLIMFLT